MSVRSVTPSSAPRRHNSGSSTASSSIQRTPARSNAPPAHDSPTSSHVETSVTKLLVTTKQLLESLTRWSEGSVTADQVSDHFVATGNYFNVAVTAFTKENIPMDELMSVPEDLRNCLEEALSQDASTQTLERYLPRVREIIITLLQGLKAKQSTFRARREQRAASVEAGPSRASGSGRASPDVLRGPDPRYGNGLPAGVRPSRRDLPPEPGPSTARRLPTQPEEARSPPSREPSLTKSKSASSLASAATAPRSATSRYNEGAPPLPRALPASRPERPSSALAGRSSTPPPMVQRPPRPSDPPKLPDLGPLPTIPSFAPDNLAPNNEAPALERLNSGTALERRASKRYSQYTYSKITSSASTSALPGGDAMPSVGRELVQNARQPKSEGRPMRRPSTEGLPAHPRANGVARPANTLPPMREDEDESAETSRPSSVPKQPLPPLPTTNGPSPFSAPPPTQSHHRSASTASTRTVADSEKPTTFPLSIYLQLGRDIKKAVLDSPPSLGTLRVLFTERFQYNPGMSDFPAIYLRDPREQHGVQYELEDVSDIRDRCVLSLNIEPLDAVKEQIATGLAALQQELKAALTTSVSALQQEMKDLHSTVSSSSSSTLTARRGSVPHTVTSPALPLPSAPGSPSRPSDRQFAAAAQKMFKNSSASSAKGGPPTTPKVGGPSTLIMQAGSPTTSTHSMTNDARVARIVDDLKTHYDEVQSVRREVGTLRQVLTDFGVETKGTLAGLRSQAANVRHLAASKIGADRGTIRAGKEAFEKRMDDLIPRLEELQDVVDDLRSDVSSRGVRPRPQQIAELKTRLDALNGEVEGAKTQLATLGPAWKHGWEQELEVIIREQEFLRQQEPLLRDASADVTTLMQVFETIVRYASAVGHSPDSSSSSSSAPHKLRSTPRIALAATEPGDRGNVFAEVRALAPDPEKRLRAIEQAERAREAENASRSDAFKEELGGFVDGKRLKRTGGAEEADRVREVKSHATIRAMFASPPPSGPEPPQLPPLPASDDLDDDDSVL